MWNHGGRAAQGQELLPACTGADADLVPHRPEEAGLRSSRLLPHMFSASGPRPAAA